MMDLGKGEGVSTGGNQEIDKISLNKGNRNNGEGPVGGTSLGRARGLAAGLDMGCERKKGPKCFPAKQLVGR